MKWLILIALISCGKHQEPAPVDYGDTDGDQIRNYAESDFDKYVANFDSLGKLEAKMTFYTTEKVEYKLSNSEFSKAEKLMVSSEKQLRYEEHFSEWSNLKIENEIKSPELKQSSYDVQIDFSDKSNIGDEIILRDEKASISLGEMGTPLKINLTSMQIQSLLKGKAFFSMRKKFKKAPFFESSSDETIRKKTYRVLYKDGKKSKILYVAKELSFDDLLKLMNIKAQVIENEDAFFFNSTDLGYEGWFSREFSNGDKVLIFAHFSDLRKEFETQYVYKKSFLSRTNGNPDTGIKLNNKDTANIYLRIRPLNHTQRTFVERKDKRRHGYGGGGVNGNGPDWYDCYHHLRSVKAETSVKMELATFLENVAGGTLFQEYQTLVQNDDKGIFWEMRVDVKSANYELLLKARDKDTYVVTGEYSNSCAAGLLNRGRDPSYQTNVEGNLSFEVESFVEKIE